MTYTAEYIKQLKQQTDIIKLLEHFGVKLTKKGKQHQGICPFHNDHNASLSVNPAKGLYHCFGSGCTANQGGDSLTFIQLKKGLTFQEAVKWLSEHTDFSFSPNRVKPESRTRAATNRAEEKNGQKKIISEKKKRETFNRYLEICQNNLAQNSAALTYLKKTRGLHDNRIIKEFKIGFANGSVEKLAAADEREILTELGILNSEGKEKFKSMLTFPLFENGTPVCLYGRSLQHNARFKHQYLENGQNGQRGLLNEKALRVFDEIIVCESVIDALTLITNGINNTTCVYGLNGLTQQLRQAFQQNNISKIYWAFDNEEKAARKAAAYAAEFTETLGITSKLVKLPEGIKDINDYFAVYGRQAEQFKELLLTSELISGPRPHDLEETETNGRVDYVFHETDFILKVMGVPRKYTPPLKVSVKLTYRPAAAKHYDNLDLYSYRARQQFCACAGRVFGINEESVSGLLLQVLEKIEQRNSERVEEESTFKKEEPAKIEIPDTLKREALKMLSSPDLFKIIAADIETIGFIGEPLNACLGYTIGVSHKTENPSSVMIRSRSASGKTALADAIELITPEEDTYAVTSLTKQALYYIGGNGLSNKLIRFGENIQDEEILYQIRELLSSGRISRMITTKDEDGNMRSKRINVEGPVTVIDTSTRNEMNEENLSRYIVLNINEAEEQTKKINDYQRFLRTKEGYLKKQQRQAVIRKHKAAVRLLEPIVIFNQFAPLLNYPTRKLIARRGNQKFLDTIEHITFLRQKQYEVLSMSDYFGHELKYIVSTPADYALAYDMFMNGVLVNFLSDLSIMSRKLHQAIIAYRQERARKEGKKAADILFTRKQLSDYTGYSMPQIRDYIQKLEEYEIVGVVSGGHGGRAKLCKLLLEEAENLDLSMIPKPEQVVKMLAERQKQAKQGQIRPKGA